MKIDNKLEFATRLIRGEILTDGISTYSFDENRSMPFIVKTETTTYEMDSTDWISATDGNKDYEVRIKLKENKCNT